MIGLARFSQKRKERNLTVNIRNDTRKFLDLQTVHTGILSIWIGGTKALAVRKSILAGTPDSAISCENATLPYRFDTMEY